MIKKVMDPVDEASAESFPASDPPAWIRGSISPKRKERPGVQSDDPRHKELIAGLNEDLAGELGTIIRYNYQAGQVSGPIGEKLREIFRSELSDELGHAAFLTDAIVDLGGEPTTEPAHFEKPTEIADILAVDIRMEWHDVELYTAHARLADELGEVEIKLKLEEIAADESRHARRLERILRGL